MEIDPSRAPAGAFPFPAGRRLGRYEIVAPIGAGGMGEVYRARDLRLHRDVALKVLPPALVADPERRTRFELEARAASALEHPHIAVIHEIDDDAGVTFIAMELVRGEPLADAIARGSLTTARALDLAVEIAEGLAHAHDTGIVHRDLKPANVMLTEQGHAKIIDFGVAKLIEVLGAESALATMSAPGTQSGAMVGTAAYMSPEQARGSSIDHRSDVFSFGIMLYEMLSGRPPFRARTGLDTLHAILHDAAPPLPLMSPVAADLQRIVEKCLAKAPEDRYQGMRDLVVDLRAARRRLEASAVVPAGDRGAARGPIPAGGWSRSARLVLAGVMTLVMVAASGVWIVARRARAENERNAAIAEIERLVDRGRFVDAWRAAQPALRRWPRDPRIERMLGSATMTVTLATDPPGADVAFKAYDDVEGPWLPLGRSPLSDVRAPLGMLRWRITKPGFEPLEARLEVGTPAAAAGRPDVEARPIRLRPAGSEFARMVFVPGGRERGAQLSDYWLDLTEVTNRDFKSFVDRGGYTDRRYWTHLDENGGDPAARYRDRTGRPGPSTWELGTYPEGREEYPVGGVSWYEAVAFCRAAGKTLPTLAHWRRAFGETFFMEVVTVGNFAGRGPEPVTRVKDVEPWGTYGMAGNVKEWVWNEADGRRYILGGAWNEPVYMAIDDDVRPPFDRAETNGFRCIKETAPSEAAAYAGVRRAEVRDYTKGRPVDDATFAIFRSFYAYDPTPLDAKVERTEDSDQWRRERVSFAAAYNGERVLANILIPKNTPPPYQAVVWFPGSYALGLSHSDGTLPFSYYYDFLPRSGRALVYPVYAGTYERRSGASRGRSQDRDLIVQWSKDLGRTIDYLASRSDFDSNRIAYYGFSMGASAAIPGVALEPRLKTAIFLAGGLYESAHELPEADPLNFVPRITAPVLLLAGRYDFYFPVETSQKALFNLLGTPAADKKHVIFEGAGHVPPRLDVIRETLDWLDRYLGPVPHRSQ